MEGISLERTIASVAAGAETAVRALPEPFSRGVEFVESLARAGLGVGGTAESAQALIDKQIELQQEMLQVTMLTNIERTRHETRMAPARNIRLG